ncbi:hypothetical protein QLX08_008557 [Tetragonisca angustula]|uniref:Uncharacterized protein n=1 Tax=Tetragonisca angustula TaxID=166442 RepID=A0AAW0ZMI7_9HYME
MQRRGEEKRREEKRRDKTRRAEESEKVEGGVRVGGARGWLLTTVARPGLLTAAGFGPPAGCGGSSLYVGRGFAGVGVRVEKGHAGGRMAKLFGTMSC